jgi:hypothetical protein
MRFKRVGSFSVGIAIAASGCGRSAYAPFPPAEPHVPRVSDAALQQSVAQLESDDWRVRQRAQDKLFAGGQQALPALRAARADTRDPEIAQRLDSAICQLERISPTLVTLDPRGKRASAAFRELGDQAGVTFAYRDSHDATLPRSIGKVEAVPFWVAVQRLCRAAHLKPQPGARGPRTIELRWAGGFAFADRSCASGAAFFELGGTGRVMSPGPGDVHLQMFVYADPSLQVVRGPGSLKLTEAVDEHGRSLLDAVRAEGPATKPSPGLPVVRRFSMLPPQPFGYWMWPVAVGLPPPPPDSRRIARLRGTVSFQISTLGGDWPVERPAEPSTVGLETEAGGWRVRFEGLKQHGEDWWTFVATLRSGWNHVDVRVAEEFREALRVSASSDAGIAFPADSPRLEMASDGSHAKLICTFRSSSDAAASPPGRLVFQFPQQVRAVDVPFEFTDLPLPGATSLRR